MCSRAGDARMSPALEDTSLLLLVFTHRALNARLRYLNKNFGKDIKKQSEDKDLQMVC